ncbi:MAG: N-acetyl-gamma-glutamyl-phosphate reductase [Actinobacteria bacterium]|jgi:N-acetyl-gamma-glutamyl-phosphate reductase|uniref:N-acetyl-gamma-glutamyl-phosphate reductase n=1 Tax=freshwater metagenome TaxID=449393 RepID=A0A6J6NY38_9ZZZZ|nr:N-acetyl-gamma-glutamyl-phosphate reductase [Actinomycetota bacterium]
MKIGVVGASGYAGGELLRLLAQHPKLEVSYISAGASAGEFITSVHPHLTHLAGEKFATTEFSEIDKCELVFFALPHGESGKIVSQLSQAVKIVDLGADFRLSDSNQWVKYYGGDHAGKWIYGLPEIIDTAEIAASSRVANPGCYATAISLATAPALDFIETSDIVVVAASGTTGAGRSAKINLLGSEVMNSLTSYKFGGVHQHTPEIEECLTHIAGKEVKISFTPILAPMPRGILATITAKLTRELDSDALRQLYKSFYKKSEFVSILSKNEMPKTSSVLGTNNAQIQVAVDNHTDRVVISCAIDNLGKGAAGQAVQNANLMLGYEEGLGLTQLAVR